jgi:hypothetical protein
MKTESVYKYRSGNNELRAGQEISDLERDIQSIEKNSLFASSIDSLNDPCEAMVFSEKRNQTCFEISRRGKVRLNRLSFSNR